eukprot:542314-Amphidinium_carterae.1
MSHLRKHTSGSAINALRIDATSSPIVIIAVAYFQPSKRGKQNGHSRRDAVGLIKKKAKGPEKRDKEDRKYPAFVSRTSCSK